tara:strand:- start:827 stop:2164 length:1338 start_codon:yes stop_codon:yes gene_type:complete
MRIAVVGSGYVGLVSGACFADAGHSVHCVDLSEPKVAALQRGEIPIYEPGLDALVAKNATAGRLSFSTDVEAAVADADVVFIAVGTPSRRSDGHADLSYVYGAARTIAKAMTGFTVVVTKSTVPVGTGDEIERMMREMNPNGDFAVVSNPEFLREGAAIDDFQHPDRVVVGLEDQRARAVMAAVYAPLEDAPLQFVSRRASELIKYASNSFLAMKITFINEIADLCEAVGANVKEVAQGVGLDSRIGAKFLNAGPGYGGSCFPKDTLALVKTARDHASPMHLIETTIAINDNRKRAMARKVIAACGGSVRGKTIGILGLTFKPNTDDMRDSPALSIIQALQDAGARIRAYDPEGMGTARDLVDNVYFGTDAYDVARDASAVVLVTEWEEFRTVDVMKLRSAMATPVVVDLRNLYQAQDMASNGMVYSSIGRSDTVEARDFAEAAE